jgi:hypothetical protein
MTWQAAAYRCRHAADAVIGERQVKNVAAHKAACADKKKSHFTSLTVKIVQASDGGLMRGYARPMLIDAAEPSPPDGGRGGWSAIKRWTGCFYPCP